MTRRKRAMHVNKCRWHFSKYRRKLTVHYLKHIIVSVGHCFCSFRESDTERKKKDRSDSWREFDICWDHKGEESCLQILCLKQKLNPQQYLLLQLSLFFRELGDSSFSGDIASFRNLKTTDRYSSHKSLHNNKITCKEGKIRNEPMEKNQEGAITISTASSTRSRSPKHTCRCLRPIFAEATLKRKQKKKKSKTKLKRKKISGE